MVLAMTHTTKASSTPNDDRLNQAKADLHAASRAAVRRLRSLDARQAERELAAVVYAGLDEATAAALRRYDEAVEARVQQQAEAPSAPDPAPYPDRDVPGLLLVQPSAATGIYRTYRLSAEAWARLRRPFDFDDVQYTALNAIPESGYGTISPILDPAALRNRLDEGAGPEGWSLRYACVAGGLVKGTLRIGSAEREGFGEGNAWEAAQEAWRWAAVEFGIGVGLEGETVLGVRVDEEGHVADWEGLRVALVAAGSITG